MARRSVMKHQFSQVPRVEIPRSSFDRSHGVKTTFDAGYLVPIFVDEALPGDTFNLNCNVFCRLATPLHPFMDNMFVEFFFFACPIRLVWDNFVKMMGEQDNPGDSTSFIVPTITAPAGGYLEQTVYDYFGIPTKIAGLVHSALWNRAYQLIYNQWFRDENLQNSFTVPKGDGPDTPGTYTLHRRGKRHDYFTSCLPFPQKGPAVSLPLGTSAPITGIAPVLGLAVPNGNFPLASQNVTDYVGGVTYANARQTGSNAASTDTWLTVEKQASVARPNIRADFGAVGSTAVANLSTATAATINQLRQAFQIQRIYERDARGGTRYTELIQAHFGVTSPDARLQRTEYLGGGSVPLNVNPIAQTSNTPAVGTPQGNLAAMGTAAAHGVGFTKSFTEHSVLIGLVNVRADLNYQDGLNRMFSRSTRFDFYWPALAHIGEQAVLNKEIFAQGTAADADVFGYQERFAEYRYKPSIITGKMRSNATGSLDTWHLAQDFTTLPALNASFIVDDPPIDRVIAVPTEPHILLDSYFRLRCARPMPVYSVPGLIDHF